MQSERIWLIVYNDKQQDLLRDYQAKYQIAEKEHELQLQEQKNHQSRRLLAFAIAMALMFLALAVISLRYATQRKRQTDMLKRLNQTKDHLFSVVSHDIKTPVMMQEKILNMTSFVDPEYGTGGEMGTGIGLFVSQQLLKRNGEDIRIESKEGQGTQAFFSIKQYQNGQ